MPGHYGRYIFADYCSGTIYGVRPPRTSKLRDIPILGPYLSADAKAMSRETLLETSRLISSFAQDYDGELYLIDRRGFILALR